MVLTTCYTRVVMGLVVVRGVGCYEELLLDDLNKRTTGLVTDGDTNVEEGMIG